MAMHVLKGEFPAFLWGQAFKGVPEAYVAAGAFAVFGPSVTVLKSVTLVFFAAYVALNFILLDKIAGQWLAVTSSLLLIVAPPALVFWSLDASAEYILIMLLGTSFLLLCLRHGDHRRDEERGKRDDLFWIGLVVGVGFWVHQIFAFYLLPALVIFAFQSDWWTQRRFGRFRVPALTLGAVAAVYLALAAIAFFTTGFSLQFGSMTLSARAPQKLLRIAAGIGAIAIAGHLLGNTSRETARRCARRYWPLAAGFVIGYSPVLLYSVLVEPARSPARVANLDRLMRATPDIFGNIIPILSGFKIATTERLDIPVATAAAIAAALVAYALSIPRRLMDFVMLRPAASSLAADFFPLFTIVVPLLFIASGAYLDTQSYRYLIPYYAGLCVALAAGSLVLAKHDKKVAAIIVGTLLMIFALQQIVWYRKLTPDTQSAATIQCLRQRGVRGGFADYWTSYTLTFLSHEEIILAPTSGVDRYPRYTEFVRSLPAEARWVEGDCN